LRDEKRNRVCRVVSTQNVLLEEHDTRVGL
jgi:hypothetical protein